MIEQMTESSFGIIRSEGTGARRAERNLNEPCKLRGPQEFMRVARRFASNQREFHTVSRLTLTKPECAFTEGLVAF